MTFNYIIDLYERGEFKAHVEDANQKTVLEVDESLITDGWMKHIRDIVGLTEYLRYLKIMGNRDTLKLDF